MRNLFICFLLATLAWLLQRGPDPMLEPATYLGILVVFPLLGARLARNWGFPPGIGAIAAGAALTGSGLLGAPILDSVSEFRDAGFVWLGLFIGTQVARRPNLSAASAASSVSVVIACTLLVCVSLTAYPLTLLERLQVGLAASVCAPIYTMLDPTHHRDQLGITGLATGTALLLLALSRAAEGLSRADALIAAVVLLAILLTAELAYRALRSAVSGPGRYLVHILIMGGLWSAAARLDVHPGLAGLAFGFVLGCRARRRQETLAPLREAAAFVGPFVLGVVAAEFAWPRILASPPEAWVVALAIIVPAVVGKALAGAVAGQLTRLEPHDWTTAYPMGLGAMAALPVVVPDRLFLGNVTYLQDGTMPVVFLAAVGVPIVACAVERVSGYVASRRKAAAASGGMELT